MSIEKEVSNPVKKEQPKIRYTFQKEERLKSRKVIEHLFSRKGKSVAAYPLRVVWITMEERKSDFPVQFTVSVSKKRFKLAVDRNRVKRQIRETWRLRKHLVYEFLKDADQQVAFMVIYTGKEKMTYVQIHKAMKKLVSKFKRQYAAEMMLPKKMERDSQIG